ncbi:8-amino-7-oxononanoate synthase [Rhizorhabdus dicambivorans]|uniref:8-amino-7-oxononanoate synthase n=1 Tax=Rhizorhabdus dicambivorans TaxID=1850238 RepID=A0A2A4FU20_9SPHN|nr:8-amino-7-oxononanoate synthase [Rhizorhabdus dicambivorans]ATE64467.1 8-amino-7-oxononanoate synthase [Rhizorhabdus dicambivorans]PCE41182.1 8-amino-7-oxononanoate synthase [Rhizorhabdus dicambivorans]
MSILDTHREALDLIARRSRTRRLIPRAGHDFASNDYLGLANSPELRGAVAAAIERGVAIGAGGSRLLRGNDPEHEALEAEAAAFFGSGAALFFSTGFAANSAILSTLPAGRDLIVHDALIHASVHEGLKLGRATTVAARHNDVDAFADAVRGWRAAGNKGRVWIAVESLYSMDGDIAPLDELAELADREEAFLIVDEAHATGVFGPDGRGLAHALEGRDNVVTLRTCGKALGCEGALVCAPRVLIDILINKARGFIFSTAPSPLAAAAVRASIGLLASQPERRERLARLVAHAGTRLPASGSQILPLIIGEDGRTMEIAGELQGRGFDVRGIRPPTVPPGTSRLRISLTLNADEAAVDALADAIGDLTA